MSINIYNCLSSDCGKIKSIYIWIFSFFFSFFNVTGYFFDNISCFEDMTLKTFTLFSFFVLIFTPCAKLFFTFLYNSIIKYSKKNVDNGNKMHISLSWVYIIILSCFLVIWLAFFPGLCNYDFVTQVPQVLSGVYSKHHPLVHTLIIGNLYLLGQKIGNISIGITIYMLIQIILFAGALTYLYGYIREKIYSPIFCLIILVFFAIYPAHSLMAISTAKDTIFTLIIIFAVVLSLKIFEKLNLNKSVKKELIILFMLCVLMMLFRNNGVYALFPVVILSFFLHKNKKIFLFLLLCICTFFISDGIITSKLKATPTEIREYFSAITQQMARIYTLKNNDEVINIVKTYYNTEDYVEYKESGFVFKFVYSRYLSDTSNEFMILEKNNIPNYLKDSAKLFFKYPLTSIDSYFYLIQGAYYIFEKSTHQMYEYKVPPYGYGHINQTLDIKTMSLIPQLEKLYTHLFTYDAYIKYPAWRLIMSNALFVWILIFSLLGILSYKNKNSVLVISFFIFLLLTVLLAHGTCTRYYLPIISCSPLFISMFISDIREDEKNV